MKQTWLMRIYKVDKRTRTGERLVGTYTFEHRTEVDMEREVQELKHLYPSSKFRFVNTPKFKTVKNLMSGKMVEIDADTPRCCDPSSETYWTM